MKRARLPWGRLAWAALLAGLLAVSPALADPTPDDAAAAERAELERRIEELEARDQLRDEETIASESSLSWPRFSLGGFANVDYLYRDVHQKDGRSADSNHFALGELDFFVASELSDHFSFFSELVFEFDSDGETRIDVERLLIKYEHRDWLSVSVGRGHSPIGYWNRAYHHGTFLWTTISRPVLFEFEDEGGLLPMHFVGVETSGNFASKSGLLGYSLVVSNGRGRTPDAIQLTDDLNGSKLALLQLAWKPYAIPDITFGANFVYDDIPGDPATPGRERNLHEYIAGGHVVFTGHHLEAFFEGQYIRHEGRSSHDNYGGYAQLAYDFGGGWKPYYRFDWLGIDEDDPFFALAGGAVDTLRHTAGIRYEWTSFLAVKLEYQHEDATGRDTNVGAAQVAVRF